MFWFYTRSFREAELFDELTALATLPNCKGWLSIDSQNFFDGLNAYSNNSSVWKLAFLQETDTPDPLLLEELSMLDETKDVVVFPYHRGGYHVKPLAHDLLFTCPAVTGKFKLQTNSAELRPCQACNFCLP